jgi:hypothetical protein
VGRDHADAKDVLQDTFIAALRSLYTFLETVAFTPGCAELPGASRRISDAASTAVQK